MSLKLNDMKEPSAVSQLNRWAEEQERRHRASERQLLQLNQYLKRLHELNPDLQRPNLK